MSIDLSGAGGHPDMDYNEIARTYRGFLRFTQVMVVALVLLLAGMAIFLV